MKYALFIVCILLPSALAVTCEEYGTFGSCSNGDCTQPAYVQTFMDITYLGNSEIQLDAEFVGQGYPPISYVTTETYYSYIFAVSSESEPQELYEHVQSVPRADPYNHTAQIIFDYPEFEGLFLAVSASNDGGEADVCIPFDSPTCDLVPVGGSCTSQMNTTQNYCSSGHCCPINYEWISDSCQPKYDVSEQPLRDASVVFDGEEVVACGPQYNTSYPGFGSATLCEPFVHTVDGTGIEYICAANDDGWRWFLNRETIDGEWKAAAENPNPVPQMLLYSDPETSTLTYGNIFSVTQFYEDSTKQQALDLLAEDTAIGCFDGSPVTAELKSGPPKALQQGYCPSMQCVYPLQNERIACQGLDAKFDEYVCVDVDGTAEWVSPLSTLANTMLELRKTNDDFVLNCGNREISVNDQNADSQLGYCQLIIREGESVSELVLGVAFDVNEEDYESQFLLAAQELHSYTTPPVLDDVYPEDEDNEFPHLKILDVNYAEDSQHTIRIGLLTSGDNINRVGRGDDSIWQWLQDFLTTKDKYTVPVSSSQQFYFEVIDDEGRFFGTEFNKAEALARGCSDDRIIVEEQVVSCYSDSLWRQKIQQR